MNTGLQIALAAIVLWLARPVFQCIATVFAVMRTPIWPVRLLPDDAPGPWTADEQAALDEVRALGFEVTGRRLIVDGPNRFVMLFLTHASLPAFAAISFRAAAHTGYPVAFYSVDAEGTLHTTSNRVAWTQAIRQHGLDWHDAYAANLSAHWDDHRARTASVAVQASPGDVLARLAALTEDHLDDLRRAHATRLWRGVDHYTLRASLRIGVAWWRKRKQLARPYTSAFTGSALQSDYFASCYRQFEAARASQSARHDVKAWLFVLSVALFLIGWGVAFDWFQACAVVGILLVHESGHALAMRMFGYRDMSMFFIPFLGAVVTGTARDIAAWKQAVILLAGPMPGLIVGLGYLVYTVFHPGPAGMLDWHSVAAMSIGINLFNLLPITPLDGGRLMEIALFARWPRARLVFVAVSVLGFAALAAWLMSVPAAMVAVGLAMGLLFQKRLMTMQRAWNSALTRDAQIRHLFETARLARIEGFVHQFGLVRTVMASRLIRVPRLWESVLVLGLMGGLWGGIGAVAIQMSDRGDVRNSRDERVDTRTPVQRRFDAAMASIEDDDADAPNLDALAALGNRLGPDDPRQVDVRVARARAAHGAEAQALYLKALAMRRDGTHLSQKELARESLGELYRDGAARPPVELRVALQSGIDDVMRVAPAAFAGTVQARLRIAEAIDRGGDAALALTTLDDLLVQTEHADDCQCELREVVRARSWYLMSHGQPGEAVRFLKQSAFGARVGQASEGLTMDYAWALLDAGRIDAGVAAMTLANRREPYRRTWLQRIMGVPASSAWYQEPLEMAHALMRAGRDQEAQQLVNGTNRWSCRRATGSADVVAIRPWEGRRHARVVEVARQICAAPAVNPVH